ncbi:MAG: hypothetical protein [Chaetfec virus UA24_144]|nr:MAG: hypothetical protein [Chaetfec virus UA24_144]
MRPREGGGQEKSAPLSHRRPLQKFSGGYFWGKSPGKSGRKELRIVIFVQRT